MPYVNEGTRIELDADRQDAVMAGTPGELNYIITREVLRFIEFNKANYTTINAAIGALECAKLELYRRLAAPYENRKIQENGDVYP